MDISVFLVGLVIIEIIVLIFIVKTFSKKKQKNSSKSPKQSKKFRLESVIITAIYLVVFGVTVYLLITNLVPTVSLIDSGSYIIDASSVGITSKLKSLYLDKDVLGSKIEINGEIVRPIISGETFNIVFNPKKVVADDTTAILEMNFHGKGTELYMNDELIIPDLTNYELISTYTSDAVYIRKDLSNNYNENTLQSATNSEDFIYKNFPGTSVYSFKETNLEIPTPEGYTQVNTKIRTTFRDNLKLAIYHEGDLRISFTKQDLNNYLGRDEYTVEIKDHNGKSYYLKDFEDDGEKKDSKELGEEQDFTIKVDNLPKNIYYITFTKDKNNRYADSTIKDIEINSNKFLILDKFLLLDNLNFYTKVIFPKKIEIYYWSKSKEQKIYITGAESEIIDLDEEWFKKRYGTNLTKPGDYNFEINLGFLWIYSDLISISKENWFDLPAISESKFINPDLIIIDTNKLKIMANGFYYEETIKISEGDKISLKVLDENKLFLEKIEITL